MTHTHLLGIATLASQVGLTGFVSAWLYKASRESRTWRRPIRVPKLTSASVSLSSGSDFVGVV